MSTTLRKPTTARPTHPWLKQQHIAYAPGPRSEMLDRFARKLLETFERLGHIVQDAPTNDTDALLTTAQFGESQPWREAFLFTARRRFGLKKAPTVITLVQMEPDLFAEKLAYFEKTLAREEPDPEDYAFPGMAPDAYRVLHEQGRRGGAIMALERLIQAQTKSIRVLLVVGDEQPEQVYHFDLVGAHPASDATDPDFYEDVVLRQVTSLSTREITEHEVVDDVISRERWLRASAPKDMRAAARELGERHFFTEMVRIADLVRVPAVDDAVSSQYSEGCFTTWDPEIDALITTVTGSARPVDKGSISEDDLAVIVGVREDGQGALVSHVEGKRNDPPSSEAVEMMDMDYTLPTIALGPEWEAQAEVPVIRSKLHGHRGVRAFDPELVEHVPLTPPYYHYPVSCATEAQATGIKQAFARSEALQNPDDPRKVVFTVLPGHGVVIAEKWIPGKKPFQVIWEFMDSGKLQITNQVPQGEVVYAATNGLMELEA